MHRIVVPATILALILPVPVFAVVIHVFVDGSGDAPTIAAAYAMANIGDEISVGPGTYYEHDIVMQSLVDLYSESNNPDDTIVDAQGLGRCLDGASLTGRPSIRAMTFQNGTHLEQGGILLAGQGGTGGGHNARYYDCVFRGGRAPRGGAVATLASGGTAPDFINCVFELNEATASDGGAIWSRGVGTADGCIFRENSAAGRGGAVYSIKPYEWGFSASACTFEYNSANGDGGAFYSEGNGDFYGSCISGCLFVGNAGRDGGAARLNEYDIVQSSTFLDNEASRDGGALFLQSIQPDEDLYGDYVGNLFARNTADQRGGALAVVGSPTIFWLNHCTLVENGAPTGGHLYATSNFTIIYCIFAFATGGASAAGTISCSTGCTDVFGNIGGDFVGPLAAAGSGPTNFSADPLFCDVAAGNFTLHEGSPCLPPLPSGCSPTQIGALGQGCGPVSIQPSSWGKIKSLYR
jgi:predicted outer membrane repeat protein